LIYAVPDEITGGLTAENLRAWTLGVVWEYVGMARVPQWLLTESSPMDTNDIAIATMDILFIVCTTFGLLLPSPQADGHLVMLNAMVALVLVYFLLSLTLFAAWGKLQVPL
jgi:hypothetical protein